LREELGPEFDDLRQPLNEIQKLRGMSPRAAITKHLLDGDDSFLTGNFEGPDRVKPQSAVPPTPAGPTGGPAPYDPDAT
jgi:sec-independent protein translocase protein TatB